MFDLKEEILDELHSLNDARDRAKKARERGLRSLRRIKDLPPNGVPTVDMTLRNDDEMSAMEVAELAGNYLNRWTGSGNKIEVALLVKAQSHQNLSESDAVNDKAAAWPDLVRRLREIEYNDLSPDPGEGSGNAEFGDASLNASELLGQTVPVLLAARALQSLTTRAETVFSKASMLCYYRIVRELYSAAPPDSPPDWIIGAARAGTDGRTSAFITSECIRGVFGFERAVRRTSDYFEQTLAFYTRFSQLKAMLESVGILTRDEKGVEDTIPEHPLSKWADKEIERMYLDWYISTNQRNGAIALYCPDSEDGNLLSVCGNINLLSVQTAFDGLKVKLEQAIKRALGIKPSKSKRVDEKQEEKKPEIPARSGQPQIEVPGILLAQDHIDEASHSRKKRGLQDAHNIASSVISTISENATKCFEECKRESIDIRQLLEYLHKEFKSYPGDIHERLEPTKRYVRAVLDHELAIAYSRNRFDAGELVFAATAYGTAMNWPEKDEKLLQACKFLVEDLPENGRLVTNQPFHATEHGYKLLPIGCEMTRHLAKLMHRTHYEFKPEIAGKMLNIFTGEQWKPYKGNEKYAGWNFENAPKINHPSVWVSAVSVQALDRIVRMLNDRINEIVFKHFKVVRPENPRSDVTLNELLYSDHGLTQYGKKEDGSGEKPESIAIRLEQMRAHVMRAALPAAYDEKVFSAIFYGPPGTGKTTLLEALARSSKKPLIMLSPSDLIVQGPEQLEGRARAVFDALSMLSQSVILLDEFEPVLHRRSPKGADRVEVATAMREGDVSMLSFLLTGMLPKLVSLHEAAQKQSLVYCLATNKLEEIDDAAKRSGRFDVHQGIYNPDPISRAGTFLFNLHLIAEEDKAALKQLLSDPAGRLAEKFAEIVTAAANENAGELSRRLIKPPKREESGVEHDKRSLSFKYVIEKDTGDRLNDEIWKRIEKNRINFKFMGEDLRGHLDAKERNERERLLHFEKQLNDDVSDLALKQSLLGEFLKELLTPRDFHAKGGVCELCGVQTNTKEIQRCDWFEGKLYVINCVEAEVCPRCGRKHFHPGIKDRISKMLQDDPDVMEVMEVRVVSMNRDKSLK